MISIFVLWTFHLYVATLQQQLYIELIRYSRVCDTYHDFLFTVAIIPFQQIRTICVTIDRRHVAFVVITILSYPIAWLTIILFNFFQVHVFTFYYKPCPLHLYSPFFWGSYFSYVIYIFNIYWCPTLCPNQMMFVWLIVTRFVLLVEQEVSIRPEHPRLVGFGLFILWFLV
jgi:hypothetical protein